MDKWILILKAQNSSPKHLGRPLSSGPRPPVLSEKLALGPLWSLPLVPAKPSQPIPPRPLPWTHQGTAAKQNHENDEGLKPVVLDDEEAGLPQDPPGLAQPFFDVYLAAFESLHTTWHQRERWVSPREPAQTCPLLALPGPTRRCPTTQPGVQR